MLWVLWGRCREDRTASGSCCLGASEQAGTLESIARNSPVNEEAMVQRWMVTCPRLHDQLMVQWDRIQASWALAHQAASLYQNSGDGEGQ